MRTSSHGQPQTSPPNLLNTQLLPQEREFLHWTENCFFTTASGWSGTISSSGKAVGAMGNRPIERAGGADG